MEKRTTILSEGAVADLTGCGKSLNRDDSPPQGLKPSLVLHDLRGAKAPLYHSAAGFRDFFRSLLEHGERKGIVETRLICTYARTPAVTECRQECPGQVRLGGIRMSQCLS